VAEISRHEDIWMRGSQVLSPEPLVQGISFGHEPDRHRPGPRHPKPEATVGVGPAEAIHTEVFVGVARAPALEFVRHVGRRLAIGCDDLAGVLHAAVKGDRLEEGPVAVLAAAQQRGQRHGPAHEGDVAGIGDPRDHDGEPGLGHLLGREGDRELAVSVRLDRRVAGPGRGRVTRATEERTDDDDRRPRERRPRVHLDHPAGKRGAHLHRHCLRHRSLSPEVNVPGKIMGSSRDWRSRSNREVSAIGTGVYEKGRPRERGLAPSLRGTCPLSRRFPDNPAKRGTGTSLRSEPVPVFAST
jgi:hypothetical protein